MSECSGPGCTHPDHADRALRPQQYGTSMHYPYCIDGRCTGCLPPLPAWIEDGDPVVKFDGRGEPVRVSQLGGNRAERRAAAREAREAREARRGVR